MASQLLGIRQTAHLRRARVCAWCRTDIPADAPATRLAGVTDGKFFLDFEHPECTAAAWRDPCHGEEEGCVFPHVRGKTCEETCP
jgi:hypothetical protein